MNVHVNNLGTPKGNEKVSEKERLLVGLMHQSGRFDVGDIAAEFNISRQEVYNLGKKAESFLSRFPEGELFSPILVITEMFIKIAILILAVCCKVSYEDILLAVELLFNRDISMDYVSRTITSFGIVAESFNNSVDYSRIEDIALDEIFKKSSPYLTGIDLDTTYVWLLKRTTDRTGETWKKNLDSLKSQGFKPHISVSDAGSGMKNGLGTAYPDCMQHGDVFHNVWDLGRAVYGFEAKTLRQLDDFCHMEYQVFFGKNWVSKTAARYENEAASIDSALIQSDDLTTLYGWVKELLGFSGYSKQETLKLLNWTLDEMLAVVNNSGHVKHEIQVFRNRIENAVSFIDQLNIKMTESALKLHVSVDVFKLLYRRKACSNGSTVDTFLKNRILHLLHGNEKRMAELESILDDVIHDTKRASSLVENLNSRVRIYLNDKRGFSDSFAHLLQLAINTKRYRRSRVKSRHHKSPLELLTGDKRSFLDILLPNWRQYVAA